MSERAEWAPRFFFAECAECLDITTSEVFSAMPTDEGAVVIYTPGVTESNTETVTAYLADLRRDADGILRVFGEPRVVPDFYEKIKHGLALVLGEGD